MSGKRIIEIRVPEASLHDAQKEIILDKSRFKVIAAGRRFGKTFLAAEWLSLWHGGAIDGMPVALFSAKYTFLLDVYNWMLRTLRPIIKSASRQDKRITLITGGHIDFWTLVNPDAGRSRKYGRVVLDEAALCRNLKEVWERAIRPTLTDLSGEAWFISTNKNHVAGVNYFECLFNRGDDPQFPDWKSWKAPSSCNPHIPKEDIEEARRTLPDQVFRQEYLGEFVNFSGGIVSLENIHYKTPIPGLFITIGVDLAISTKSSAHYSTIVAIAYNKRTDEVYVIGVERFRGEFSTILSRIFLAAERYKPSRIAIESVQFQTAVAQEIIRKSTLPIIKVRPDGDKITRFIPLAIRYQEGKVFHDPQLPQWFTDEVTSFPNGEYDDCVDALVYAFRVAHETQSTVIAYKNKVT